MPGQTIMDLSIYVIGAIAFESYEPDGSWKVYMGFGRGDNELEDCGTILNNGMPIGSKEAACGFFPELDPDKFRY